MQAHKTILIVEDDPDDRELLLGALQVANPAIEVQQAENGQEALDYLARQVASQAPLPCLIVLDLNMPYLDGKATFQKIRNNSHLSGVPIVIFTSSHNPNDKVLFNNYGVELISKPFHYATMDNIAHHMLHVCTKA